MRVVRHWGVVGAVAAILAALLFSMGSGPAVAEAAQQGTSTTLRERWLTVEKKTGRLSADQGRLVFLPADPNATGPNVVEEVGPDYIVFAMGGTGSRLHRIVHMTNVDLHFYR
jgi:hypothetical protein